MRNVLIGVVVLAGLLSPLATAAAQDAAPPSAQPLPPVDQNAPLQVQLTISRYRGEKRVSSMPYTLSFKTSPGGGTTANLAVGTRVPVPMQMFAPGADGKPGTTTRSYNYENVGINIDCGATLFRDGRYELRVRVNESSVVTDPAQLSGASSGGMPLFRSYTSNNTFFVKDGETVQFTAATDTVSGEVVRVEARLTAMK